MIQRRWHSFNKFCSVIGSDINNNNTSPHRNDHPNTPHFLSYDFIAITERMDESAVELQMLLGLPLADVLYLNAKTSGGYEDIVAASNSSSTQCRRIQSAPLFHRPCTIILLVRNGNNR
jgi:hypothetical protein